MIKTILFDCGGVLGSDAEDWDNTFKAIPELTGLNSDELDQIWDKHWPDVKLGKKRLISFWEEIKSISKNNVSVEELTKAYEEGIWSDNDILDLAKKLKQEGFDTRILSNESKIGMEIRIRKFNLKEVFSKIYNSADLGLAKPNDGIYEYVLNDLNVSPEDVIFIDNLKRNIGSAEKIGIKCILFKNLEQLKEDLASLGISAD